MIYLYQNKFNSPNFVALEILIKASAIADAYDYFRWDEDIAVITVILNRELTLDEKLILDSLVAQQGLITEQFDTLNGVLLQQNIDLNNL